MFQQLTLVGNLGADPTPYVTNNGVSYTKFSVAATETWYDANRNKQERTVWFRCTAWDKNAENIAKYLTKGSKVLIVGTLEEPYASLNKDTNQPQASMQVRVGTVKFLGDSQAQRQRQAATNGIDTITEEEKAILDSVPWAA